MRSEPFFGKREASPFFAANPAFLPVQTKLHIGQAGDKYEREADQMADRVVAAPNSPAIQNKCAGCEGEEESRLQAKPFFSQITSLQKGELSPLSSIQRDEGHEEESLQTSLLQKDEMEEEESMQASIQRQEEEEETMQTSIQRQEEEEAQTMLQKQGEEEEEAMQAKSAQTTTPAPADLSTRLHSRKGQGDALAPPVQNEMESHFAADFSQVRVHTDSEAASMSQSINAQAFTHGNDIYFNSGKYDTSSNAGKHLLAHELTHTVQQGATGPVQKKESTPPDLLQRESAEVDEADLARQLEESNQEAQDATDPTPAQQARTNAADEFQTTSQVIAEQVQQATQPQESTPNNEPQQQQSNPPTPTPQAPPTPEPGLGDTGPAGQALDEQSANACANAGNKAARLASNEKTHDTADSKLEQSKKAVVPPTEEGQSKSNNEQVKGLDQVQKPEPDKATAQQKLNEAIQNSVPNSIEALNEFKSKGKAKVVGSEVLSTVNKDVAKVKSTYDSIEQKQAPQPSDTPQNLPPKEQAPSTAPLNLGKGAVPPLPQEHTNFEQYEQQSDELLRKEEITQEQLDMVDSGDLAEAKNSKQELRTKVNEEPAKIQQFAGEQTQQVEEDLKQEEQREKQKMKGKRQRDLDATKDKQTKTKSDLEKKREAVTNHINGIYDKAKESVTQKLEALEKEGLQRFDEGQKRFSREFEDNVNRRVKAWKRRRYSGILGGLKWAKDKLFGIDDFPEIKNIFETEKQTYIRKIDQLIIEITQYNNEVINGCKEELAKAKQEMQEYVDSLGPELQQIGQQSLTEMTSRLNELDKFIDKKKEELQQKLCDKREEAIKAIDKKIEAMKSEMSGLVGKLANLLIGAAIKFFKWALEKAGMASGQLMNILNKGKAVIKAIVTKPVKFIMNLVKAVKNGISGFVTRIKKYLLEGLVNWLSGSLGNSGIQMPKEFSLKGILSMVLQVAGLTWNVIRTRIVKKVGEKVVSTLEKSFDIVKKLVTEGPMALWETIKQYATEIKTAAMEGIRNLVIVEVVKQGVIKLASFLNPAGALVQAIIAIYNTVMFFVENWDRIVEFVKTVFSSIGDIAMGNLSAAAQAVERAMGMTIPIILNFLLRILGLGNIGAKIRKVLRSIQKPIKKVMDKIVGFIIKKAKKLFGKIKGKADKRTPEQKQKDVKKAVKAGVKVVKANRNSADKIAKKLKPIKRKYRLSVIKMVVDKTEGKKQQVHVYAKINPDEKSEPITIELGRVLATDDNKAEANKQLPKITKEKVGHSITQANLDRYKYKKNNTNDGDCYEKYIENKTANDIMDWPLSYLKRRAAMSKGKKTEEQWIKEHFGDSATRNNAVKSVVVRDENTNKSKRVKVIPDYIIGSEVGDVKNVKSQSYTQQLRAMKAYADSIDATFSVIVRNNSHPDKQTYITGPLSNNATIHRIITE